MRTLEEYRILEKAVEDIKKEKDSITDTYLSMVLEKVNEQEEKKRVLFVDLSDVEKSKFTAKCIEEVRAISCEGSEKAAEYGKQLSEAEAKLKLMQNKLLEVGKIPFLDVIELTTELMSIYFGKSYTYKQVKRWYVKNDGVVPEYICDNIDLIVSKDESDKDVYTKEELETLYSCGEAIILMENRVKNRENFSLFIESEGSLVFASQFERVGFVLGFFERVIDLKFQIGKDLDNCKLRELKNQYLFENLEMLESRYVEIDQQAEEEYKKIMDLFEENRAFRTKTKEFIKCIMPITDTNENEE